MVTDNVASRRFAPRRAGGLKRSIVINAVAGGLSLAVALVIFPVYVSALGATAFGVVLISMAIASVVVNIDLGMGAVVARRSAFIGVAKFERDYATKKASIRLYSIALLPTLILGAYAYIGGLHDVGGMPAVLALMFFGGFMPVFFRGSQARFEGAGHFVVPRSFMFGSSVLRILTAVFVGSLPEFLRTALVLIAETSVLWLPAVGSASVLWRTSKVHTAGQITESWSVLKVYGAGSCVSAVVGALVLNVDIMVIGLVLSPAAVLIFAAGSRIIQVYRQVVGWVMQPLLSKLTSIHAVHGNVGLNAVWVGLHPGSILALAAVASSCLVAGNIAIPLLLPSSSTQSIEEARWVLVLLCAAAVCSAAHQVGLLVLAAKRAPLAALSSQLIWAVLRAILGGLLGHAYGLVAAAVGILVATALIEPFYLYKLCRVAGIPGQTIARRAGFPAALTGVGVLVCGSVMIGQMALGALLSALLISVCLGTSFASLRRLPSINEWSVNV